MAKSFGDKFISEIEIIDKMINSYIKSLGDLKESANPEIQSLSPKSKVQSISPKP